MQIANNIITIANCKITYRIFLTSAIFPSLNLSPLCFGMGRPHLQTRMLTTTLIRGPGFWALLLMS